MPEGRKHEAVCRPMIVPGKEPRAALSTMTRSKLQPENLKNMKTAKQVLETYLAAISASDMEGVIALFADDGGIELPYFGSVNLPIRYQGPEALRRFFSPVIDGAGNF